MNIDTIIELLDQAVALAQNIKASETSEAAITSATSGDLVVNETEIAVSGSNFETLLAEQITAFGTSISSDLTDLDGICDSIKAEIIA